MTAFLRAASLNAAREARAALRDPGPHFILPALPALLMLVVFSTLFDAIGSVADLGDLDYAAYLVPGVVVLVAMLGAGATSSTLGADVRGGYVERLRLVPFDVTAVLVGRLMIEALRLVPGVLAVLGAGLVVGGGNGNGFSALVVVVLVCLLGAAYSGLFLAVAAVTADPQTPFMLQPLGLPLAFLSTALVPLPVMPSWAESLARVNPVTVVVDGSRAAMLEDVMSAEVGQALSLVLACLVLSTVVARVALGYAVERRYA